MKIVSILEDQNIEKRIAVTPETVVPEPEVIQKEELGKDMLCSICSFFYLFFSSFNCS